MLPQRTSIGTTNNTHVTRPNRGMLLITPPSKAEIAAAIVQGQGRVPTFESDAIEQQDVEQTGEHLAGVSAAFETDDGSAIVLGESSSSKG